MFPQILTVTFNPAIDRMVRYDRADAPLKLCAGGKGINVARAAQALGLRVQALALSGGASGRLLQELLRQEQLPHRVTDIRGVTRVNTTRVYQDHRVRRAVEPGPVVTAGERRVFTDLVRHHARRCRVIVFSGSLPSGYPVAEFVALLRRVKRAGLLVALDARGPALKAALHSGADIIKPNRAEAEGVLGFKLCSRAMIRKALRVFAGYGIKKVLISLGKDGVAGSDGHAEILVRTPVLRGGHAVGCGDAALAGFLVAQLKGSSFEASVACAAACGAANVLADVPGGINEKDVQSLLTRRRSVWF